MYFPLQTDIATPFEPRVACHSPARPRRARRHTEVVSRARRCQPPRRLITTHPRCGTRQLPAPQSANLPSPPVAARRARPLPPTLRRRTGSLPPSTRRRSPPRCVSRSARRRPPLPLLRRRGGAGRDGSVPRRCVAGPAAGTAALLRLGRPLPTHCRGRCGGGVRPLPGLPPSPRPPLCSLPVAAFVGWGSIASRGLTPD